MRPTNFVYHQRYMLDAYRSLAAVPRVTLVNNSEAGAADYAAWLGVPRERYLVKRNGIDTGLFQRAPGPRVSALRAALGVPEGAPLIGSIFRLYAEKRPLLWVEMAALVGGQRPDAHFVVFGTGPLQSEARALGDRLGLGERLHFPGTTQAPQAAISAMDLLVLTSGFEGTPNVVLEAQLLGVPVVATEAGGTREALAPGITGWLVDEPTPAGLSERVLAVLADPAWRKQVRDEGPRFVAARFGLDRMIAETLALYDLEPDQPIGVAAVSNDVRRRLE
jgi:glycosyltransferase involved in cell wall biosynthesis